MRIKDSSHLGLSHITRGVKGMTSISNIKIFLLLDSIIGG